MFRSLVYLMRFAIVYCRPIKTVHATLNSQLNKCSAEDIEQAYFQNDAKSDDR